MPNLTDVLNDIEQDKPTVEELAKGVCTTFDTTGIIGASPITQIVSISQADLDNVVEGDYPTTLFVVP